jgi:hypothetical protein
MGLFADWSDAELEAARWTVADQLDESDDSGDWEEYEMILTELNARGLR